MNPFEGHLILTNLILKRKILQNNNKSALRIILQYLKY